MSRLEHPRPEGLFENPAFSQVVVAAGTRTIYTAGQVSIDADGKLVGDVHPDVWEVAGHVSPNPGGVGPLTRAFLLTNVVELAESGEEHRG